jgi:hypothetical protein
LFQAKNGHGVYTKRAESYEEFEFDIGIGKELKVRGKFFDNVIFMVLALKLLTPAPFHASFSTNTPLQTCCKLFFITMRCFTNYFLSLNSKN